MLITLKEYCLKHNKNHCTARQRAARGSFKTAQKIGRDWFIEEDEPWIDNRADGNSKHSNKKTEE